MKQVPIKNSLMLLLTATIWGVAFVAQQVGMDFVGPFAFNTIRCFLGGLVLIPVILMINRKKDPAELASKKRMTWIGGACCGVVMFFAANLQQLGIQYTNAGKAGFITALYIVIVPILGIFLHKKAGLRIWISVAISVVGLYLLCMKDSFALSKGDFLIFLCAIGFSFHILVIDHFGEKADGVKMSCIQFFVAGILTAVCMFGFETLPTMTDLYAARYPILYAGILSSGVAFTLQICGQKNMNPTVASLIMSLESVISVIAAWILLGQVLSTREIMGCVLMFTAIVLAQIPAKEKKVLVATPLE
ncbi:MAG: DMT family transporter [Evtepia sp.]